MQYQKSPERGLCLLTSFAMALNVSSKELLAEIGESWKLLCFDGLPIPYCWRGVHIQEMIQAALQRSYAVTPVELIPQVAPPRLENPVSFLRYTDVPVYHGGSEENNWKIFNQTITTCSGVLTGVIAPSLSKMIQRGHAVAFEKGVIFDPDTKAYLYSQQQCEDHNFYVNCAWRVDKIEVLNELGSDCSAQ